MPAETSRLEIVSGWKDIANYLGMGVRTVQRYEREFGLPIRRPAGKSTGSVMATKPELDGWVTASPIRAAFHLLGRPAENAALLNEFRRNIKELRRLREESKGLREELHGSLELLRSNLACFLTERDPIASERRLLEEVPTLDPSKKIVH